MGVLANLRRLLGVIIGAVIRRKPRDGGDNEPRRRTISGAPSPLSPSPVEAFNAGEGKTRVGVPEADRHVVTEPSRAEHDPFSGVSSGREAKSIPRRPPLSDDLPFTAALTDVVTAASLILEDAVAVVDPPFERAAVPESSVESHQLSTNVTTLAVPDVDGRGNESHVPLDSSDQPNLASVVRTFGGAEDREPSSVSTEVDTELLSASEGGSTVTNELTDEATLASPQSGVDEIDLAESIARRARVGTELIAAGVGEDAPSTPTIVEPFDDAVVVPADGVRGDLYAGPLLADESSPAEAIAAFGADKIDLVESVRPRNSAAAELIAAGVEKDALATPTIGEDFGGTVIAPPAESVLGDVDGTPLLADESSTAEAIAEFGGDDTEEPRRDGSVPATRRRQVPYERPPEPATEYTAAGLLSPPLEYRRWNRAIAEHLLLKISTGSGVYLTITPRILARALLEVDGTSLDPDRANDLFADAVSQLYRSQILTQRGRLRVLRRVGDDGLPDCIAVLALSVLAAYRMRGDEEATGLAYYVRFAELLQCDVSGAYPVGFDPIVFESLWHFLRDWLAQRLGCQLVVPAPEAGHRRFVGLPLAHVPLRSLDIEKLPDFFVWAGYQPSSEVTHDRLAADFARWIRARGVLTPTGVAAFDDARRPAVLAEIRAELDSWDGTCEESFNRRSAAVEILFDPVQQRPELFYVPRRPPGFPTRFDDGIHTFEASDDGWYGRISVAPQDGGELASGFTWQAPHSGVEFALRRAAASVISLAPSDDFSYSGFMSARGLRRGVRCAVLCREDVAHAAAEYLSHVSERPCTALRHPDLPVGWSLFAGVLARRAADAPAGFESIDVQANVGLIPSGGIRLGNRWTWLHGAPPRIIVTGAEPGLTVTVDGEPATVGEDGILQPEGPFIGLGAHVIQVGPLRRTVEIVEPSLPVDPNAQCPQSFRPRAGALLALPAGSWTIVGAVPGQIARAKYGHRAGTIVESAFTPSWAIRIGPDGAANVLNVFAGAPPPPVVPTGLRLGALSTRGYLAWATEIYDVAVRHPRINSLTNDCESLAAAESWRSYARCASEIKRRVRRFRR